MTVTLGVDPHKASHTVVATDQVGRQLTQTTTRGTRTTDHQELIGWARQRWPERTWAVEDCRHVAGRLLDDLLAAGEQVVLVPPRLMAQTRQAGRVPGKSDPIDALAVARARWPNPSCPGSPGRDRPGTQAAGRPSRGPGRRAHPDREPAALALA